MRPTLVVVAALALALPGCATIESIFKPHLSSVSVAPPPPAATAGPPLPPLTRQLSDAEERRLRDQAIHRIADAERAARGVQADVLQPGELEALGAVQSFLHQAQQALADRQYDRAASLARKAEVLAQDLPRVAR